MLEYEYPPLHGEELRLIELQPGNFDDDIHFRLVHQPLVATDHAPGISKQQAARLFRSKLPADWEAYTTPEGTRFCLHPDDIDTFTYGLPDAPEIEHPARPKDRNAHSFEALSYVWGNSTRERITYVLSSGNDPSGLRTLKITANLETALRYLRLSNTSRRLWIDAISINQDDTEERSTQVLRMRDIYSHASRVVSWLGPPTHDSQLALDTISYLGEQLEISTDGYRFRSMHAKEPDWFRGSVRLDYSPAQWNALTSLFQRQYFERLWVVQEIAAAHGHSIFQCGHAHITWYTLRRAVAALDGKTGVSHPLSYCIRLLRDPAYGFPDVHLQDIILIARQHECVDPRDRVYAVASLLGPQLCRSLHPSYSLAHESTFTQVFLQYLTISARLDLLAKCLLQDEGSMPSWVPSWEAYPGVFTFPGPGYHASGLSKAHFQIMSEDVLSVKGTHVATVLSIFEPAQDDDASLTKKLHEIQPGSGSYVNGEDAFTAWTRTLLVDQASGRYPQFHNLSLDDWKDSISSLLEPAQGSQSQLLESQSLRATLSCMSFFKTEEGYFGFGPPCMQKDDKVCVLLGLYIPLVLRALPQGSYQVIGWAYVHGVMDGEALLGPLPQDWSVNQYLISDRYRSRYWNTSAGELTIDDPRLGPLPDEWQRIDADITTDDPMSVEHFEHVVSGERINYDPRMTVEMLEDRSIKIEDFNLV